MNNNKYEEFDKSLAELKNIENKLELLTTKNDTSLKNIMELKEQASIHYKICNDVLSELKESPKQTTNE